MELKEILVKEIPLREITFTEMLPAEIGAQSFDYLGYRTLSKLRGVCFSWKNIIETNKNFLKADKHPLIQQIKVVLTRFNNLEERNVTKFKMTREECKEIINRFKRNCDEIFMGNDEDKYRHDGPLTIPILKKRHDIGLLIALTKEYSMHKQEIADGKYEQITPSKSF